MKNAKVVVCTSDKEGFPMNLIEAMACKAKVVSSDCNFGPNEILIDKYSEYLVKSKRTEEYISKINKALKYYPTEKPTILKKCEVKNVIIEYEKFMLKKIGE